MARHYGTFARNSQPVAIFSGLRASTVAGNIASYAAPPVALGAVARTEGNFAAEVGPITRLGMAEASPLGAARSRALPRRTLGADAPASYGPGGVPVRLGANPMNYGPGGAPVRLGYGPGGAPIRLGMDIRNQIGPGGVPARLGQAGRIAQVASGGPAGLPVRLGASTVAGNIASYAAPPTRLGASTVAGNIASYAAPPLALGRYFGGLGQDDGEYEFSSEELACIEDPAACGEVEKPESQWNASDYAKIITAIGGAIAPTLNAVGQLINPRTGMPLTQQQADLYRRYQDAKAREEAMPKWLLPVGIAAGVGIVAILLLKK